MHRTQPCLEQWLLYHWLLHSEWYFNFCMFAVVALQLVFFFFCLFQTNQRHSCIKLIISQQTQQMSKLFWTGNETNHHLETTLNAIELIRFQNWRCASPLPSVAGILLLLRLKCSSPWFESRKSFPVFLFYHDSNGASEGEVKALFCCVTHKAELYE